MMGIFLEHHHALARCIFHPLAGVDVAEQQVAAFLPPQRPFGRTERTSEAARDLADRLGGRDDLVQRGIQSVDAWGQHHFGRKLTARTLLCPGCTKTACSSAPRSGRENQYVPARNVGLIGHDVCSAPIVPSPRCGGGRREGGQRHGTDSRQGPSPTSPASGGGLTIMRAVTPSSRLARECRRF